MNTENLDNVLTPEQMDNREKYYEQNVRNPYPSDSQSEAAYKKGFYEGWETKADQIKGVQKQITP